jgi:hypothetical protein
MSVGGGQERQARGDGSRPTFISLSGLPLGSGEVGASQKLLPRTKGFNGLQHHPDKLVRAIVLEVKLQWPWSEVAG